jgi:hypothetical protein
MNDLIALDSWIAHAATCKTTMDEFAEAFEVTGLWW